MSSSTTPPTIVVNGRESIAWTPGTTVSDIIQQMNYTYPQLVVSVNGTVVLSDAYTSTEVPAGADVRIIHLMAGG